MACSKQNKHPHHMGQDSYSRAIPKWIKDKRLSPPSSTASSELPLRVTQRAKLWKLGHEVKTQDGSWVVDPNNPDTIAVASRIDALLASDTDSGNTGSRGYGVDVLTQAIGKPDVRGRVKVAGAGYRKAFGRRKDHSVPSTYVDVDQMRADISRELDQKFEQRLEERVAIEVQKALSSMMQSGNFPFAQMERPTPQPPISQTRMSSYRVVQEPTQCLLAAVDPVTGNQVVVSSGMAYPQFHGQLRPGYYTVSVLEPFPDCEHVPLPVPAEDGITTQVGSARGHFLDWPAHLVIWEDGSSQRHVPSRGASVQPSSSTSVAPLTSQQLGSLGVECRNLYDLLQAALNPNDYECVIELHPPFLYYKDVGTSFVAVTDIEELLRGDCINISCFHVYQL